MIGGGEVDRLALFEYSRRAATGSLPPTCSHGKPGSQGRATLFDAYVVERLAAG